MIYFYITEFFETNFTNRCLITKSPLEFVFSSSKFKKVILQSKAGLKCLYAAFCYTKCYFKKYFMLCEQLKSSIVYTFNSVHVCGCTFNRKHVYGCNLTVYNVFLCTFNSVQCLCQFSLQCIIFMFVLLTVYNVYVCYCYFSFFIHQRLESFFSDFYNECILEKVDFNKWL